MKRGEIYYISQRPTTGSETAGARPAVIVSNDVLNATSGVVLVVYLTTKPKKEMPTHVIIHATGVASTAICEHIDHVSTELIGDYRGTCTEEELGAIEDAMLAALGIELADAEPASDPDAITDLAKACHDLIKACAERDVYKNLVEKLTGVDS